jgi:hypothetical protein
MPPYIYKGFARGSQTLVNLDETCKNGGSVGVPTGKNVVTIEAKELPKVAKELKLSGTMADKIGKLKVENNESKERKLRSLSPIKFSIYDNSRKL